MCVLSSWEKWTVTHRKLKKYLRREDSNSNSIYSSCNEILRVTVDTDPIRISTKFKIEREKDRELKRDRKQKDKQDDIWLTTIFDVTTIYFMTSECFISDTDHPTWFSNAKIGLQNAGSRTKTQPEARNSHARESKCDWAPTVLFSLWDFLSKISNFHFQFHCVIGPTFANFCAICFVFIIFVIFISSVIWNDLECAQEKGTPQTLSTTSHLKSWTTRTMWDTNDAATVPISRSAISMVPKTTIRRSDFKFRPAPTSQLALDTMPRHPSTNQSNTASRIDRILTLQTRRYVVSYWYCQLIGVRWQFY